MTALRIAIIGHGKMGRAIESLARAKGHEISAIIGPETPVATASLNGAEVAIEFSEPGSAAANVIGCVNAGCPVVVGTTGWYDGLPSVASLVEARDGAVLWDPNFAVGVHAVAQLFRRAGEIFAGLASFDAAIVETHHAAKLDAPSGTARMLQTQYAAAADTIVPITSIRVGSVPGTHKLLLDGAFEQIVISHEARDRRVFAEGALMAAGWLIGRRGMFTLDDMFASKETR